MVNMKEASQARVVTGERWESSKVETPFLLGCGGGHSQWAWGSL
jgi:hypothetical protein